MSNNVATACLATACFVMRLGSFGFAGSIVGQPWVDLSEVQVCLVLFDLLVLLGVGRIVERMRSLVGLKNCVRTNCNSLILRSRKFLWLIVSLPSATRVCEHTSLPTSSRILLKRL